MELVTYKKDAIQHGDCTIFIKGVTSERRLAAAQKGMNIGNGPHALYAMKATICDAGITNITGLTQDGEPVKYSYLTDEIIDTLGGDDVNGFLTKVSERIIKLSELDDKEKK